MTTVAIIGAGAVGRAIGARLLECGDEVRYGVRDPDRVAARLSKSAAGATVGQPSEAVEGADLIMLAVPGSAAVEAVGAAGDVDGRALLDCTNSVRWEDGPVWAPPPEGSVAQAVAAAFPGLEVVKGLNHFGVEIQRRPGLMTGPADALFAGDDPDAKSLCLSIADRMGFRAHDAGPLRNAALLENLAVLWIHLATTGMGRTMAFRVDSQA